jgi:hypothetical protein
MKRYKRYLLIIRGSAEARPRADKYDRIETSKALIEIQTDKTIDYIFSIMIKIHTTRFMSPGSTLFNMIKSIAETLMQAGQ